MKNIIVEEYIPIEFGMPLYIKELKFYEEKDDDGLNYRDFPSEESDNAPTWGCLEYPWTKYRDHRY